MHQLTYDIIEALSGYQDRAHAVGMEAYMKNQFRFLGVAAPLRKTTIRSVLRQHSKPTHSILLEVSAELFDTEYREHKYVAVDLLIRYVKLLRIEDLPTIEQLILKDSWWDTVDFLSGSIAGPILRTDVQQLYAWVSRWRSSPELWLQRSALLVQLKFREATDVQLLFDTVTNLAEHSDFFIRKAAGWALRNYSKIDAERVRTFLQETPQLSNLTVREASRYL